MVGAVKDFKYRELAGQEVYDNVIADVEDKANNMFDKEGFQVEFEKESAERWEELDEKSKKVVNQKQKVSEELAKQTDLYESALKEIDELRFDGKTASEALAEIQAGEYKTQAEVDADTQPQNDAAGTPVYQQMDYAKVTPLLTAALQELIAKVETLEAEVASLKSS